MVDQISNRPITFKHFIRKQLPWLMLLTAGFCLRLGISSLSPVLDQIQSTTGIDSASLGVLTAIPVVCMGLLSPIGYLLEQKWGLRRAMLFALLLLSFGMGFRLAGQFYPILFMTAGLVGIADAIIRPLLSGFIKDNFQDRTSSAMSLYAASMGIGSAIAAAFTAKISAIATIRWRGGLAFWAIFSLIAWGLWTLWKEGDKKQHQVSSNGKSLVENREILCFTLFFGFQAGLNYTMVAWLPAMFQASGYTSEIGSYWFTVFVILQTMSSLFFHRITTILKLSKIGALYFFTGLLLVGSLSLYHLDSLQWLAPISLGIATGGLFTVALILPLDFSDTKSQATKLAGQTQSGGYLLGGMLPWIAGLGADYWEMEEGLPAVVLIVTALFIGIGVGVGLSYKRKAA